MAVTDPANEKLREAIRAWQQSQYEQIRAMDAMAAQLRAEQERQRQYQQYYQQYHQAYTPPPARLSPWRQTLGITATATLPEAERAFRALAKRAHPDLGGSVEAMTALNAAITEARRSLA